MECSRNDQVFRREPSGVSDTQSLSYTWERLTFLLFIFSVSGNYLCSHEPPVAVGRWIGTSTFLGCGLHVRWHKAGEPSPLSLNGQRVLLLAEGCNRRAPAGLRRPGLSHIPSGELPPWDPR